MHPRQRPPATLISLISRQSRLIYSGLVPSVVAGLTSADSACIDLRRLCGLADVAFLRAEILGLDPLARMLLLEGRPPLAFDCLSLDVGATTPAAPGEMAVKPLEPFLHWCETSLPQEISLRGSGASAVEVGLALRARGHRPQLILRGATLQLGSPKANRLAEALLEEAAIPRGQMPKEWRADLACTGSQGPSWLGDSGLPVDPGTGRVLTEPTLEVCAHPGLFASGDCGLIQRHPRPPSGVWAVRAASVLATNLRRSLGGRPLVHWRPQRWALQLLGDGGLRGGQPRALALWGPLALGPASWLWRWKQHLDHRFMASFADLQPMEPTVMACRGCAAKLPARPLQAALTRLAALDGLQAVPLAVDAPQLAELGEGQRLLQSVDGFPALVADPWLNARLTTLHACSDLWASGAHVHSVQVMVTLPTAAPGIQEDLLLQSLAGVRSVLQPLAAPLLGGHTLEGRDGAGLALTLTVNGVAGPGRHWGKGPLRAGDALLLTRPIGSGVLFAAGMAGACRSQWLDACLHLMQQSQAPLVDLLAAHGCHACTDITGFGLLGHLGEMLASSSPGVVVHLDGPAIPVFEGALALLRGGYASSLAPGNAEALVLLDGPVRWLSPQPPAPVLEALMTDPQTCGPLLAALPGDRVSAALQQLHAMGFGQAAVIAQVGSTA